MNNEQYENLISLMKEALKFYAEESNYDKTIYTPQSGYKSNIDSDEYGSQARFALKKLQETRDADKKLREDYDKVINDTINAIESDAFNLGDMITTLKNIEDDSNV